MGAKVTMYKGKQKMDVFSPVAVEIQKKAGWKLTKPVAKVKTETNGSDSAASTEQSD